MKRLLIYVFILINIHNSLSASKTANNIHTNWQFKSTTDTVWMQAQIPGCVHTDLINNNCIPDPFFRLNEHDLQWIDKKDWEYKCEFKVDPLLLQKDAISLIFRGLDTYATVYLNGNLLLKTDNMFRVYPVDVKEKLKVGSNKLHILFESPINIGLKKLEAMPFHIPVGDNDLAKIGKVKQEKKVSIYTRKAGYHFGWDWGPRLVTSGIWKPILIESWDKASIENIHIKQITSSSGTAKMQAQIETKSLVEKNATVEICINDSLYQTNNLRLKNGINTNMVSFDIDTPKLWWPNGMGKPHLYKLQIKLKSDSVLLDSSLLNIGLRKIDVIQEKDTLGTSFSFSINGIPTFMKGANYIPQDVFLDRVSKEDYEGVILDAVNANMNMLRVWGGGIYEKDIFYDLCDKYGILVWQDFMFACSMFPGDDAFLENVRQEAIDNVKRLRNHPCIALWCGNNENIDAWNYWGWKNKEEQKQGKAIADKIWQAYDTLFHAVLPSVITAYDEEKFYWPSSPGAEYGKPSDLKSGDYHYWGVWWGKEPFSAYAEKVPRFMSEFGFQSFPEYQSVKKYALQEDFDIYSAVMKSHQRSSIGNKTIEEYMLRDYKKPKNFEQFLYVGQVLQAKGIKMGIEAHRRNMPYCMGSLYWQINDCWPVASWSSTDYYNNWKAVHYAVKDAFEKTIISCVEKDSNLLVYVVTDSLKSIQGELSVCHQDFLGTVIEESTYPVTALANSSTKILDLNSKATALNISKNRYLTTFELRDSSGKIISEKTYYYTSPKHLILPKPTLKWTITEEENKHFRIQVESNNLAKHVFLQSDYSGFFSNNYFDLLPGKQTTITFKPDSIITKDAFIKSLKQVSLIDSY